MKLSDEQLVEVVETVAGKTAVPLMLLLKAKSNFSEFKLAEKLSLSVNETRNLLYRLQDHTLVSFTRKKDKKKGWYIYYWTFEKKIALILLIELKQKRIGYLKKLIEEEQRTEFYVCTKGCTRLNAEEALETQFTCPECSEVLVREDKGKKVESMHKEIQKITAELKELIEMRDGEFTRLRELRDEEARKVAEKKARALKRARALEKNARMMKAAQEKKKQSKPVMKKKKHSIKKR